MKTLRSPILLIGCGILKKEVNFLIAKNGWPVDTFFLDSALHVDFDGLSSTLTTALKKYSERDIVIFYGACHPLMEEMLDTAKTHHTRGQNCVEMLLGPARFNAELKTGAFFLLEEWACRWEPIITETFGPNRQVAREIIQADRSFLLAVKTPCSGNFETEAEAAGRLVGLPLRWAEAELDNLEEVLSAAIERKARELA